MPLYFFSPSSHSGQQCPRDSMQNRQDQRSVQHQAPDGPPPPYHQGPGRDCHQQPHTRDDASQQQHNFLLGRNRDDQEYGNSTPFQAPVNPPPLYHEVTGRQYQQQPYAQKCLLPTQRRGAQETTPSLCLAGNPPITQNWTPLFREIEPQGTPNIVIFGETGTGKSSLINMLSGEEIAEVSNRAVGCTFQSAPYTVSINERTYTLWDTAGLNEGNSGSVPADEAMHHLRDLVDKLKDGISLLVYCIRGSRYRDIIKVNYDLFTEIICQGEVPVVIVVTGLEVEERMEDWWDASAIEFSNRGMHFRGHACITTSKGKNNVFEAEYEESLGTVRTLIQQCCPQKAWVVDSKQWLGRITNRVQDYHDTYKGHSRHTPVPSGEERRTASGVLVTFVKGLITFLFTNHSLS